MRYALTAGPGDVGRRVVLRRRLPDGGLGDVLGRLERWSAGQVEVRTRTGELVRVAAADLLAAKTVPDPPVRRPPVPEEP